MAYGITEDGFVKPRMSELRQEIIDDLMRRLKQAGYTSDIQTRPDSVMGISIDAAAERMSVLYDRMEAVYNAMYPSTAMGANLDKAVSYAPVVRLSDEPSQCYIIFYGTTGTIIPQGTQVRNATTETLWQTSSQVTIQTSAAADVTIIGTAQDNSTYTITINSVPYSYTSGTGATDAQIIAGLVGAISASGVNVSSDASSIRLYTDGSSTFQVTLSVQMAFRTVGSPVLAETVLPSDEGASAGELTELISLITGVDAVNNLQDGIPGRTTETDAELRARYHDSGVYLLGAGTLTSIKSNLIANVLGVSKVRVFENATDTTDAVGRPPHSIHAVVVGGLPDAVAQEFYRVKPAGIDTYGQVHVSVPIEGGSFLTINFDRPTPVYVWVKAVVATLPGSEQTFPADGLDQIKEALNLRGQQQDIGDDVLLQAYFCAIYQTEGVGSVDLKMAHSYDAAFVPDDSDYTSSNITIADYEQAEFDLSRITVT